MLYYICRRPRFMCLFRFCTKVGIAKIPIHSRRRLQRIYINLIPRARKTDSTLESVKKPKIPKDFFSGLSTETMPYDFAVRITRSYDDFARVISRWALECDKMVVYQHEGSRTGKIHIHLAIEGSRVCREQLRNIANSILTQPCKGQGDWSFKAWDREERYIVYMTKGKHDPNYVKGYDEVYLGEAKSKYKPPNIKANPLERIYVSVFEDAEQLKEIYEMNNTEIPYIKWVRKTCLTESLKYNNTRMITPKVRQDAITLFSTYCREHNVKLTDEKDPMYKHTNLF